MAIDLRETFGSYNRRARLYPAFLMASPVAVFVILLWTNSPLQALASLAVAAGGPFFLTNWVRTAGQYLETKLTLLWEGLPTTHLLRYRETANRVQLLRRHQQLAVVTGIPMPTEAEEAADPKTADDTYITATRALIARVRERKANFPRVHEENTNYGFRRNLLALKGYGLAIVCISIGADGVYAIAAGVSRAWGVTLAVHILVLLAWLAIVKSDWVYQEGKTYAERLFDTLEILGHP